MIQGVSVVLDRTKRACLAKEQCRARRRQLRAKGRQYVRFGKMKQRLREVAEKCKDTNIRQRRVVSVFICCNDTCDIFRNGDGDMM
jgi:hypothetical protein